MMMALPVLHYSSKTSLNFEYFMGFIYKISLQNPASSFNDRNIRAAGTDLSPAMH